MRRHRGTIQAIQWTVVGLYLALLIIPAFMPVPPQDASILTNLRLFAQFLFWGVWWPGVMISTPLLGRVVRVFCPEGTLTEFASRHGWAAPLPVGCAGRMALRGLRVHYGVRPAWSACTSTRSRLAGTGRLQRGGGGHWLGVWTRQPRVVPLPVPGQWRVSSVGARRASAFPRGRSTLAAGAAAKRPRHHAVNCAPLINIRHMHSASACHACGRCAGENNAVALRLRVPTQEILDHHAPANTGDALTLLFGVIGVATAAFSWSVSRQFVHLKSLAAEWLIDHDQMAMLLQDNAPWWLLTHYPEVQDVFTWLDGLCILLWILVGGLALGHWLAHLAAGGARATPARPALAATGRCAHPHRRCVECSSGVIDASRSRT